MKNKILLIVLFLFTKGLFAQSTFGFSLSRRDSGFVSLRLNICNNTGSNFPSNGILRFNWPGVTSVGSDYGLDVLTPNPVNGIVEFKITQYNNIMPGCNNNITINVSHVPGMTVPLTATFGSITLTGNSTYVPSSLETFSCERKVSGDCFVPTTSTTIDAPTVTPGTVVPTSNEIHIGQGTVFENNEVKDVYIPLNRKGWAIGMAVAHGIFSNLIGFDALSINEYLATAVNENDCGCDDGIVNPSWVTRPYPRKANSAGCVGGRGVAQGFFQLEYTTGWAEIRSIYPCFLQDDAVFDRYVSGSNFEIQSILKTYYDYASVAYFQYVRGLDPIGFFKQTKDPYAAEKVISAAYNQGLNPNEFLTLLKTNRTAALATNDINPLFSTSGGIFDYYESTMRLTAVLDNNLGAVNPAYPVLAHGSNYVYPGVHKFRDFYDAQIEWTDVNAYIDKITPLYNFPGSSLNLANLKAKTKAAFDAINGGNSVSFKTQMSSVIDAIVINLPTYDPRPGLGSKYGNSGANNILVPTATMSGDEEVCPGNPFTLKVTLAGATSWTFSYSKPDNTIATITTTKTPHIFTVPDAGTYKLVSVSSGTSTGEVVCAPVVKKFTVSGANPSKTICSGTKTQLTATMGSPTGWISSKPSVATVNATGEVTAVSSGRADITYTVSGGGCTETFPIIVEAMPSINGILTVGIGGTTQLTGSSSAASSSPWLSSSATKATISNTGLVTGLEVGNSIITYTNSNGCKVTAIITVTLTSPITGIPTACVNGTTQLTGSGTAATTNPWVSATPSVATISNTGLVTGVSAGTSQITFTSSSGVVSTGMVTIYELPTITGTLNACVGGTTQLTGSGTAASSNAWVSSSPAIATVSDTGLVSAVAVGTTDITYTNDKGCTIKATITINALPTITGTLSLSIGGTTQLSGLGTPAAVGAWTSGTQSIAKVSDTGLVTGVAVGNSIITYTNSNGCKVTANVTVTLTPPITGVMLACVNGTTQLTGPGTASGNSWVSATPAIATISNTGLVTGLSAGNSQITFTSSSGVVSTGTVTIYALPTITGALNACVGRTTQLSGSGMAASSNAWMSSNPAIATVSNTGLVTGITEGNTDITYTNDKGCTVKESVTINALPTISGTLAISIGGTTQLTGQGTAASADAWSSATQSIATVSSTGLVTGVALGTSIITYTNSNGCKATTTIIVTLVPPITGTLTTCVNGITQLTGPGTAATTNPWTSASPAVASISNAGVVTGISAGDAQITFTDSVGRMIMATVTINALPTITGTLNVCVEGTTQLTGSGTAATSNAWVSATPSIATISNTGLVTGIAAGSSEITYTNDKGCTVKATITINSLPTITGTLNTCIGTTSQLTGSGVPLTSAGWVSSNTTTATVSNTGLVTGITTGTTDITYTNDKGCSVKVKVTVNEFPTITGTLKTCVAKTTSLTGSGTAASTNAWVSSDQTIAIVSNIGLVTGITAGSVDITYTNNNGCSVTKNVIVNPTLIPEFDLISPICQGELVSPLPTTSKNGINGVWRPAFNNSIKTEYTFSATDGSCSGTSKMTLDVMKKETPSFVQVAPICSGEALAELPKIATNNINGTWSPALNSTQTTVYTFKPDAGQCANEVKMTIDVKQKSTPIFIQQSLICPDDVVTPLPTTSTNGITGTWSPEINNKEKTEYTFTPSTSECANEAKMTIEVGVKKSLTVTTNQDSTFGSSPEIIVTVVPEGDYLYQVDNGNFQASPIFKNLSGCLHVINVKDTCNKATASVEVMSYPRFFTPNNDGNNDYWNIDCNLFKQTSIIYIYDRYGKLMKQIRPNENGWDGKLNSIDLPNDDYWFTIDYIMDGQSKVFKGHFSLIK